MTNKTSIDSRENPSEKRMAVIQKGLRSINYKKIARLYRTKLDWSVTPLDGKTPVIDWRRYHDALPSVEEVESWWDEYPNANPAVLVGRASNLIVLEVIDPHVLESQGLLIPNTATIAKGEHRLFYLFQRPTQNGDDLVNYIGDGFNIFCENSHVPLPPSIEPETGLSYKWEEGHKPWKNGISHPPKWMLDLCTESAKLKSRDKHNQSLFPNPLGEEAHGGIAGDIITTTESHTESDHNPKYLTPKDIMALEIKENQFLIRPTIYRGGVTTILGAPGVGKTWLILEIARCVISGDRLFNVLEAERGRVAYFDEENPITVLKERVEALNILDDSLHVYHFQHYDIERDYDELSIIARDVDLVIFDSLIHFHGRNENRADEMNIIMGRLKSLAGESNCAVLVIHQMNKQTSTYGNELNSSRGSGQIMYDSDMAFLLKDLGESGRLLNCVKSRIVKTPPGIRFAIKEVEHGRVELEYLGEHREYENKQQWAKTFIPLLLKNELSPIPLEDIQSRLSGNGLEISEATIRPILRELEEAGTIKAETREHGKKYYSCPLPEDVDGDAEI